MAVAQRLAQRRAGGGLDLRGVGGEPAHHLAGMRLLVEGGAQRGQVPEDVRAQVGDHALAQPVHRVHARRAGERQHQADADQGDEVEIDEAAVVAGKADIDHAPHGDRHREHGGSREDQRHQRQRHHAGMAPDIGPQREQRLHLAAPGGRRLGSLVGVGQGEVSRGGDARTESAGAGERGQVGLRPRREDAAREGRSKPEPCSTPAMAGEPDLGETEVVCQFLPRAGAASGNAHAPLGRQCPRQDSCERAGRKLQLDNSVAL